MECPYMIVLPELTLSTLLLWNKANSWPRYFRRNSSLRGGLTDAAISVMAFSPVVTEVNRSLQALEKCAAISNMRLLRHFVPRSDWRGESWVKK